jgi:hypothetical protein
VRPHSVNNFRLALRPIPAPVSRPSGDVNNHVAGGGSPHRQCRLTHPDRPRIGYVTSAGRDRCWLIPWSTPGLEQLHRRATLAMEEMIKAMTVEQPRVAFSDFGRSSWRYGASFESWCCEAIHT